MATPAIAQQQPADELSILRHIVPKIEAQRNTAMAEAAAAEARAEKAEAELKQLKAMTSKGGEDAVSEKH